MPLLMMLKCSGLALIFASIVGVVLGVEPVMGKRMPLLYTRTWSRTLPPSSLYTGSPAALPAMSYRAISTALTAPSSRLEAAQPPDALHDAP